MDSPPNEPSVFITHRPRPKPEPDHQAERAAADERDANAITRFFRAVFQIGIYPNCSRLGRERLRKPKRGPKA